MKRASRVLAFSRSPQLSRTILLLLLSSLLLARTPAAASTWQKMTVADGDTWRSLSSTDKVCFLEGVIEGLKFRDAPGMGPWVPAAKSAKEYVPLVDAVYRDKANRLIPLVLVLDAVNLRMKGLPKEDFDYRLADLRRFAKP